MKRSTTIKIPDNHVEERKYIIDIFFSVLFGLDYTLTIGPGSDYEIYIGEKKLIIKDNFFNHYKDTTGYLKEDALPSHVIRLTNDFTMDSGLPVLFGNADLRIEEELIFCGQDIFASAFFMLTRWEEYVIKEKDEFGRFPDTMHLSVKNDFHQRPVVNEYAEYLWNMLVRLGFSGKRIPATYRLIITHDVDRLYCKTMPYYILNILRARELKKSVIGTYYTLCNIDPMKSFEKFMDISESMNIKSHFYFISGGSTSYEGYYSIHDTIFKKIIMEVKKRGHIIGFHPSYATFNDKERWLSEKMLLQETAETSVNEGRQHYLRFAVPHTWQIWEDNNMLIDSSMGFSHLSGFRCGTGNEYPVFNILTRKRLNLKERPLIIMDSALKKMKKKNQINSDVVNLYNTALRYNMPLTIIFHNHMMDKTLWNNLDDTYRLITGNKS